MARVIQAIRSYPITLMLAGLCFLLSLALATASVGKIMGGDDEGSGMGGTGAPVPFLGGNDERPAAPAEPSLPEAMTEDPSPAPQIEWLPWQQRVLETVDIPRPENDIDALIRGRLPQSADEHIGEPLTPAQQLMHELADAAERDQVETVLEINIQVEDINPLRNIGERLQPTVPERPTALAEQQTEPEVEALLQLEALPEHEASERASRERIQRPELPPFQRVRPTQGASIAAPRPQPMRL